MAKKTTLKKQKNIFGERAKYQIEFSGKELFLIKIALQEYRIDLEKDIGICKRYTYYPTNKKANDELLKNNIKDIEKLTKDISSFK